MNVVAFGFAELILFVYLVPAAFLCYAVVRLLLAAARFLDRR